eukprot:1313939-Lingulodinium_polyedra.AAC.1
MSSGKPSEHAVRRALHEFLSEKRQKPGKSLNIFSWIDFTMGSWEIKDAVNAATDRWVAVQASAPKFRSRSSARSRVATGCPKPLFPRVCARVFCAS